MNKLTLNDIYVLKVLEEKGIRYKNPCQAMPLLDSLRKEYSMNKDEAIDTLKYLEKIGYIEGNGSILSLTECFDNKLYGKRGKTMTGQYTLEQKKAARFKMLEKIYQASNGSENGIFDIYEIGEAINFPNDLTEITAEYLEGEKLIEYKTIGGFAGITHYGIRQYESAIEAPENESKYFPPVKIINNILIAEKIENPQIQIDTHNSKQEITINRNYDDLKLWLEKLEEELRKKDNREILEKIKDDIDLIKTNIASEKPNKKYIRVALTTIQSVLTGLASNAIFHALLQQLPALLSVI